MTPIEFHPSARAELDASVAFYESRQEGLGRRFLAAVEEAVKVTVAAPAGGAPLSEDHRRRLVPGFPFSVIYRMWNRQIFIIAIAHQHRRPSYWKRRTGHR